MPIYHLDNNRGSADNDGLSPEAPKKDLSFITGFASAQPGDAFLLADDSHWILTPSQRVVPPNTWVGSEKNPVIIGKYSPSSQSIGQRPLITWQANTVAGDWTYNAGLNGWTYLFPLAILNLMMMVRLGDSWDSPDASMIGSNSDAAVETVDGRYTVRLDSQTVLLYAPSNVNPVNYYGKVVLSAFAAGAITIGSGRGWVTVQDLGFLETGCGVSASSSTSAATGVVIQRCRSETGGLAAVTGSSSGNLYAWVRDNECEDFGATAIQVVATGAAGVTHTEVCRNRINSGGRNSSQGGIYIQTRNSAGTTNCLVYQNEVSNYRWGVRGKGSDGCGIYCESGSNAVLVFNNVVHDQFVGLQDNSGRGNYWFGNLVYNVRRGMRITDEAPNSAGHVRLYNNTFIVGDLRQEASPFGNVDNGADYPGIWSQNGAVAIRITAKNNIIANVGGQRGIAWCGLSAVGSPSTYDLNNNWVFNFEADTLNTVGNVPLASPPTVTNAGTADPRPYLARDFQLRVPDNATAATLATDNPLALAGTHIPGVHLRNGRLRPGWCPVGAYQAVLPRAARSA